MRLHTIRHVPYEGLGAIGAWARARGVTVSQTRPYAGDPYPEPEDLDCLVVLGGPMGACDEPAHPWLGAEKRFLERTIRAGRRVLGICLGSQLVADVLGAPVRRHRWPEIGWHRIEPTGAGAGPDLEPFFAPGVEVVQWHYDTFDLPAGAIHLARNDACENQAFAWGDNVLALQFHPEMTREVVAAVLEHDGAPPPGPWVGSPQRMLEPERFEVLAGATHDFLDRLARRWGAEIAPGPALP